MGQRAHPAGSHGRRVTAGAVGIPVSFPCRLAGVGWARLGRRQQRGTDILASVRRRRYARHTAPTDNLALPVNADNRTRQTPTVAGGTWTGPEASANGSYFLVNVTSARPEMPMV